MRQRPQKHHGSRKTPTLLPTNPKYITAAAGSPSKKQLSFDKSISIKPQCLSGPTIHNQSADRPKQWAAKRGYIPAKLHPTLHKRCRVEVHRAQYRKDIYKLVHHINNSTEFMLAASGRPVHYMIQRLWLSPSLSTHFVSYGVNDVLVISCLLVKKQREETTVLIKNTLQPEGTLTAL